VTRRRSSTISTSCCPINALDIYGHPEFINTLKVPVVGTNDLFDRWTTSVRLNTTGSDLA